MALNDKLNEFKSSLDSTKTALSNKGVSVSKLTADQVATNINKINLNQTVTQSLGTRSVTLPAAAHKINVKVRCQYSDKYGPAPLQVYYTGNGVAIAGFRPGNNLSNPTSMGSTSWATGSFTHDFGGELCIRGADTKIAGVDYKFTTVSATTIDTSALAYNSTSTLELQLKCSLKKPTRWTDD